MLGAAVLAGVGVFTVMEFGGSKEAKPAATSPATTPGTATTTGTGAPSESKPSDGKESGSLLPDLAADIRKEYQQKEEKEGAKEKDKTADTSKSPLPSGSAFLEEPAKEAEPTAPIGQLEPTPERVVVTDAGTTAPTQPPDIPPDIVDQQRPESDIQPTTGGAPPAQIKIASKRYLFNNQTGDALKAGVIIQGQNANKISYNPDTFSPMGEDISIAFMQNVAGNSFEVPVAVGVWYPFYFQGHKLLETGDKILGRAAPGKNRDRLLITLNTIIFKSGKSMPVNALCIDLDGTVGVKGYVVGDRILQMLAPILIEAATSFSQVFQNRTTELVENDTTGGIGVPRTQAITKLGNDFQTQGIESARMVGDRIADIMLEDIEENKPYVLVPAGTIAKARLMTPLDVSQADYGK